MHPVSAFFISSCILYAGVNENTELHKNDCMKKILSVILLAFPLLPIAQIRIINDGLVYPDTPYMYIGVPNTLKVTGTSKHIRLTLDTGSVSKAANKNEYTATFSRPGIVNVTARENGKFVYRKKYIIRYINDPVVLFAGRADSTLSVREILASPCLSISLPGCYINHEFTIVSFETNFLYQPGDTPGTAMSKDQCMNDEQVALLKKLMPGNKILFTNIKVQGPDSHVRTLKDKLITIKP
jgi:GldM C-terminal domain